ncbi:hypothetical protein K373_02753 [Streptomyces sp. DvalAA-21]|nr:hypothetical protein K373_02753 [Streptomyces sp. DvalAA-21]RAJ36739.1 hypothetical protein K351_02498 [Streptomyces sp. DpondAA-E10]RAJ50706.1 hypothetical protein K352_01893 [Streptomyces sp. DpondAA-A50]SCE41221.1 hypothetical protein GA0115235_118613 [Streptomyces sp. DpondAA-F4a]SCM11475.1 hypothetical protein SAMN04883147_10806 [Streptomyces sp. DpondAA-F4]
MRSAVARSQVPGLSSRPAHRVSDREPRVQGLVLGDVRDAVAYLGRVGGAEDPERALGRPHQACGEGLDDLAGRGQPVARLQHAQPERLLGLLHDLQIGGDAAAPVDAELDRCGPCHVPRPFTN